MTAREIIGTRTRERREARGLSVSELARRLHIDRQVVYAWEKFLQKPHEDKMLDLAQELETSVSYLYGETDDPRPAPLWRTGEGPSSEWEARVKEARELLAAADAALNPEKQELLRIASTSARGSTLHPEKVSPVKPVRAKAQGE